MTAARLAKASALVLLCSMALAVLAGALAWGPLALRDAAAAGGPAGFGTAGAWPAFTCLPLCAVCLWALHRLGAGNAFAAGPGGASLDASSAGLQVRSGVPARPWAAFFALALLMSAASLLDHLAPDRLAAAAAEGFNAAAMVALLLAALAERVDPRFGSPAALAVALALATAAAAWWWLAGDLGPAATAVPPPADLANAVHGLRAVDPVTGPGDARALLVLQWLPALLLPAGVLALPGGRTRRGDWHVLLAALVALHGLDVLAGSNALATLMGRAGDEARLAAAIAADPAALHLVRAAAVGWFAYRLLAAPVARPSPEAAAAVAAATGLHAASSRHTSLNTAG